MSEVTDLTGTSVQPGLDELGVMPAWLTAVTDGATVIAGLRAVVPELASGQQVITACNPKLRLKDGALQGWSTSYRVTVAGPGRAPTKIDLVGTFQPPVPAAVAPPASSVGAFGSEAWRCVVPALGLELAVGQPDTALPALASLTDPVGAGALLEEALQGCCPGTQVTACRPEVMRYKPGSRCTVRYSLDRTGNDSAPTTVVAKVYRGEKGANAFAGMTALWDAGVSTPDVVTLARPLAYRSDLRLLVQGPVHEERTLKDLVRSTFELEDLGGSAGLSVVAEELAKAADGLVALHRSGVQHGSTVTWDDELADVRNLVDRLSEPLPIVAAATATILDGIEGRSASSTAEPLCPSHRSFRPAQVLLHEGRIAFIDFDGLCMAEPALDVALFRAAVRDVGAGALLAAGRAGADLERGLDALDALCDGFLDRYRAHHVLSSERVLLWETLDLLTYVLHCWTKIKPDRLPTRMALLDRHVAREALACGC